MSREKREKKNKFKLVRNIIIAIIALVLVGVAFRLAPNYIKNDSSDKTNLIINNNNVTSKMKKDIYIDEKGIIYISKEDIKNYFDKYIKYDENEKILITTSDTKVATMSINEKKVNINGSMISIAGNTIEKNDTLYIPFSELSNSVYNVDIQYIKDTDRVVIDSLNKELIKADVSSDVSIKYKKTFFSKTLKKLNKGDKVVIVSEADGWIKVRTEDGIIGYIKSKNIANTMYVRQNMEEEKQIDGKVNLVWDYYSEYAKAPNREGKSIEGVNVVSPSFFSLQKDGQITENVGNDGIKYIEWAHSNNYKVWAMFSNNSLLNTTSSILNDYEKRNKLINKVIELAEKYDIDGINLDFENMNESDKDVYSRFIIELAPRMKDLGKILSVDVTAPDGAETWSLCFNRNIIADVADYIVFMAYDQYGTSSTKEGTTAGYNWIETNITKFLGQEDVDKSKIILGVPFYTRLWKEENGKVTSKTVDIKSVNDVLPQTVQKEWNDELKQFYVEYTEKNINYKMWVEDEKSIKEKIALVSKYQLAGVAFWEKDRENENIWTMINEELNK